MNLFVHRITLLYQSSTFFVYNVCFPEDTLQISKPLDLASECSIVSPRIMLCLSRLKILGLSQTVRPNSMDIETIFDNNERDNKIILYFIGN